MDLPKLNPNFRYFDISPEISEDLAVWPGDQKFSRTVLMDFQKGDRYRLSSIQSTVHLGAHVDAPGHYHPDGESIESRALDYYLGPCQVVSVSKARGTRIYPEDLKGTKIQTQRVLLKTGSFPNPLNWNRDFNSLSPELVNSLGDQGVILIGIDTPSVDLFEDSELKSHQQIYERKMAVLEGITLDAVGDGIYDLIALPLRLKGADASPVRAILIEKTVRG